MQKLEIKTIERTRENKMIDYSQIDEGIRSIIFKLNSNGVRTLGSCDGMLAHHKGGEVEKAYVCLLKSPKTLDLMAACFKDRGNFEIALRNINNTKQDVGIEYFIAFHNKRGERTEYFNRIITGIIDGSITVSDSEKKMLSDLESILDERDSALGFSVFFDSKYKRPYMNKTKKTNRLSITDCSPNGKSRDLDLLRDTISQKFRIPQKDSFEDFEGEEFVFIDGASSGNSVSIYFSNGNITRILEVMRYSRSIEGTLNKGSIEKEGLEELLEGCEIQAWDAELE